MMQGVEAAVESGREETFAEFLQKSTYAKEAKDLAISYVEGFNAARSEIIGIASLVTDQKAADKIDGDDAFRLMNGYDALLHWMTQGISDLDSKLRLNSVVRAIGWEPGRAKIEFECALTGSVQTIAAKRVILTVPLRVLQSDAIRFHPEPDEIGRASCRERV